MTEGDLFATLLPLPPEPPPLKRKMGRPTKQEKAIELAGPVRHFKHNFENAELLADGLEYYGGDLQSFLKKYAPGADDAQLQCLSWAMMVLSKPENEAQLTRWQNLIDAFEQAKMLFARQKAFDFIASYQVPSGKGKGGKEKAPLSAVVSFAKFWLADHQAHNVAMARKKGNALPEPGASPALEKILERMAGLDAGDQEVDNDY